MDSMSAALLPEIIARYEDQHKTDIQDAANGFEQRINRWWDSKRRWKFTWLVNETDMQAINTFFNDQGGKYLTWLITDTRIGTNVTVRFDTDKFKALPIKWRWFRVELDVKEVF